MSERITLSEIAKHLNVSTVTVSKALRGKKGVSSTLAKAIQDAANEKGVSVNQFINDAIDTAIGTNSDT